MAVSQEERGRCWPLKRSGRAGVDAKLQSAKPLFHDMIKHVIRFAGSKNHGQESGRMLSRRQVLGGLLVSGVAGCASDSSSVVELFSHSISAKTRSPNDYPLSPEQIEGMPYATLGVRIGQLPRAVTVLATVENEELQWVSADQDSFYTGKGRLLRSRGLDRDLGATRWLTPAGDPLAVFAATGQLPAPGVYREIDLKHADEKAVAVESRYELGGDETLVVLGRERLTRRIDEVAVMPAWRWKTRNSFWIDPQDGRIWRSVQCYCPEMPPIEMVLLKPPAQA
jgi:hypothetical protein